MTVDIYEKEREKSVFLRISFQFEMKAKRRRKQENHVVFKCKGNDKKAAAAVGDDGGVSVSRMRSFVALLFSFFLSFFLCK